MSCVRSIERGEESPYRPWLHRFAIAWVVVTFALLILGGTVTSKGVGLSVHDWPTTYDYNMFLFPPSQWKGGIFWEHTHRLFGSVVGMMGIAMTVWLWKPPAGREWLKWMGVGSLVMVIIQGVMGGLRVTEMDYRWGIAHGVLGQVFLCMTVLIAAGTSRYYGVRGSGRGSIRGEVWGKVRGEVRGEVGADQLAGESSGQVSLLTRRLSIFVLGVMVIQLVLGAAMRHTGSGLAIPDFPSSYGRLVPPLTEDGVRAVIDEIPYERFTAYYSPGQVWVHFAHRVWAVAVIVTCVWLVIRIAEEAPREMLLRGPSVGVVMLLLGQIALGMSVIWSGRHPEIATAHQAVGAGLFATATLLAIRVHLLSPPRGSSTRHRGGVDPARSGGPLEIVPV